MNPTRQIKNALQDPALYQFLKWKYPQEPILERGGYLYPVAVYPAPKAQWGDPESVLSGVDLLPPPEESLIIRDSSYRNFFKSMGRSLVDLPTYTMSKFHTDGFLGFQCGLGSYFCMLDTCDVLEWELLLRWRNQSGPRQVIELPLRQKVHAFSSDPVHSGKGRSVGLAVSTLIAFYDYNKLYLWLQRRSSFTLSLMEGMFHVFPSFMLQPAGPHRVKEEFSIRYHFNREYLEELFNRPQPLASGESSFNFYQDPCFMRLQHYQEQKEALFLLTGVAVNLLNLRPEICTLLFIKTPEWFTYHSKGAPYQQRFCCNEEFCEIGDQKRKHSLFGFRIPYTDRDSDLIKAGGLYPDRIVPSGAAAFWLGIDTLRSIK